MFLCFKEFFSIFPRCISQRIRKKTQGERSFSHRCISWRPTTSTGWRVTARLQRQTSVTWASESPHQVCRYIIICLLDLSRFFYPLFHFFWQKLFTSVVEKKVWDFQRRNIYKFCTLGTLLTPRICAIRFDSNAQLHRGRTLTLKRDMPSGTEGEGVG